MSRIQQSLWWFKHRFPRFAWMLRNLRPSRRKEQKQWVGKSTEEVFSHIYEKNVWGSSESRSGAGSTLRATEHLRKDLPRAIAKLNAKSLFDAPCGDFNWMQHCQLGVDHYIGADIVAKLVEDLNAKYASTTPPTRSFLKLDITKEPFPAVDVFFCRDVFLHLSFEQVHGVLDNFRRSPAKFIITSTYREVRANMDHFTGGARMINLCLPPFNLPEPLEYIEDRGEAQFHRCLGVWSKDQVLNAKKS
jgi:hypothetical protein